MKINMWANFSNGCVQGWPFEPHNEKQQQKIATNILSKYLWPLSIWKYYKTNRLQTFFKMNLSCDEQWNPKLWSWREKKSEINWRLKKMAQQNQIHNEAKRPRLKKISHFHSFFHHSSRDTKWHASIFTHGVL